MRNSFIATIEELSIDNPEIMMLVADNGAIVFDSFREKFPERFINCGIAEANMVGFAAGLAACGKKPFIYTISNFMTMRAFEQIRNDICLQDMNVNVVSIGGGFAYSALGPTHHATEDLALMRVLPGLTVVCPSSPLETKSAVRAIMEIDGPCFLRLGTNGEPEIYSKPCEFELGKGVVLSEGNDLTIIVTGPMTLDVLEAKDLLISRGITPRIINLHTLKPIDKEIIIKAAKETGVIITVENHSTIGGLGSAVSEVLAEGCSSKFRLKRMGLDDTFCMNYGTYKDLKEYFGLDGQSIAEQAEKLLKGKE